MYRKSDLVIGAVVAAGLTMFCAGCGESGPEIATVEGTVTLDGEPLPHATVVFTPIEGGRPAGAMTNEEGYYVLNFTEGREGAIPGKNRVRIYTLRDPMEDEEGNMIPGSPETIPTKYNSETTLEFVVEEGKSNVANFDLDSEGELPAADEEF